jgi:ribosomal protein L7Ae-like RNA K-turn-binding protein
METRVGTLTTNDEEVAYLQLRDGVERSCHLARGVLETARMLERKKAKIVILAANVMPPDRLNVIRDLCTQQGVKILTVSDKKKLGLVAGLEVSASCVALSKDTCLE